MPFVLAHLTHSFFDDYYTSTQYTLDDDGKPISILLRDQWLLAFGLT